VAAAFAAEMKLPWAPVAARHAERVGGGKRCVAVGRDRRAAGPQTPMTPAYVDTVRLLLAIARPCSPPAAASPAALTGLSLGEAQLKPFANRKQRL
jgi:hypothetical protein